MNYYHISQIISDGNKTLISFNAKNHDYITHQKTNHIYQIINPVTNKKEKCFLSYVNSQHNFYFYYLNLDSGSELINGQYNANFIYPNITFWEYLIYFK